MGYMYSTAIDKVASYHPCHGENNVVKKCERKMVNVWLFKLFLYYTNSCLTKHIIYQLSMVEPQFF